MIATEWHLIGGYNLVYQKRFGRKVGHVLYIHPGTKPARWNAFFDGRFLGSALRIDEAQRIVDEGAT